MGGVDAWIKDLPELLIGTQLRDFFYYGILSYSKATVAAWLPTHGVIISTESIGARALSPLLSQPNGAKWGKWKGESRRTDQICSHCLVAFARRAFLVWVHRCQQSLSEPNDPCR